MKEIRLAFSDTTVWFTKEYKLSSGTGWCTAWIAYRYNILNYQIAFEYFER